MISFDISCAFDVLDWCIIADIINILPIFDYMKSTLKNYMSNKLICLKYTHGITWLYVFRGCPQGSCLGLFTWTLVADRILKKCNQRGLLIVSYADDRIIIEGTDTRSALESKINTSAQHFSNICSDHQLQISAEKSVSLFNGSHTLSKRRPIFKHNDKSISAKNSILYLGFLLDSNFRWMDHLDMIQTGLNDFPGKMRKSRSRDRGIPPIYLKISYNMS